MNRYEGLQGQPDKIVGGGKHVTTYNHGHEVCNFLACPDGKVYGHVETIHGKDRDRSIFIEQLGASRDDDAIDEVTVVWTATNPQIRGRYIVGWYENSRVYRDRQYHPRYPTRQHRRDKIDNFRIEASASDATLIPVEERGFVLGRGKGWMGHAQWWFPLQKATTHRHIATFLGYLSEYLDTETGTEITITETLQDDHLKAGTREAIIQARIGQGEFRRALLGEWHGCAVTGCDIPELLRASHIKPWRSSNNRERVDRQNGLLLLAGIDAAFDRGFISFGDDGRILVAPILTEENLLSLGLSRRSKLRLGLNNRRRAFLRHHRETIFKG